MRFPRPRLAWPSQSINIRALRNSPLSEISGSLGDLGTLLPLLVALTVTGSISMSTTLVFTGLSNILTGLTFSIPLPVQPMKAIAAVAISRSFTKEETASAGLFVAGVIAIASVTGLLGWIGRVVPIPVVKGIQVGAGLSLVLSAGTSLFGDLGWITPGPKDNLLLALAAFALLLITTSSSSGGRPRIPFALIIFVIGLILACTSLSSPSNFFQIWQPSVLHISGMDFREGALTAGLGQLPLTTLNSIIAVTHLSSELLPSSPVPSPTALGVSVALMNLIAVPFGSMPVCHGSGGLAGQYRFGARSGSSVILLGLLKLVLGLAVSDAWVTEMLGQFPRALLGIMVVAAGVELASVGEGLNVGAQDLWERSEGEHESSDVKMRQVGQKERKDRWMVMMVTVAGLLAFKNDAVGFVAGLCWHWSLQVPQWVSNWRNGGRQRWARGTEDAGPEEERVGLLHGSHD